MSIKNVKLEGNIESQSNVEVTRGEFSKVSFQSNGDTITLLGKIREVLRESGSQSASMVEVIGADGKTEIVTSGASSVLKSTDGQDRPYRGETIRPVHQAQAGI